nr:hypothetical protein [Tanacetum cinerariifolium]
MSAASSAVTYTVVYTDSEPRRVFWGANEELSDEGSPHHQHHRTRMSMSLCSYSHMILISCQSLYTPSIYHYVAESDPEEDPEEYKDGPVDYSMDGGDDGDDDDGDSSGDNADDEDEEDEEEHLAPDDSAVVIPTNEFVTPPEGTTPVIPPPSTDTATTGARITVQLQTAISFPPEAKVERLLAMFTPSPSPLTSLSPPSAGERLARYMAPAALPSPPLPKPLHMPSPVDQKDDIPETEMQPRKRLCLFTLGSRYEVGYGIKDAWIDPAETVPEIAPTTVRKRVDLLMKDMIAHHETIQIVEDEAYAAREAWAHSIGLSQEVHSELQTHQEQTQHQLHETRFQMKQTEIAELRETDRRRQAQMAETLRVMGDMRREMGDMHAELLALREQPRRAGQPKGDARVPNHQEAPRDADNHI